MDGQMKRGRPRKSEDTAGITGAMLQRARAISLHPILETPFGQLAFQGEFTEYQVGTREKVMQIYADCRQHIGLKPDPASPSLEVGIGRSPVFEDDNARERAETILKAFDRVQDVLWKFPAPVRKAFHELCIDGRSCPPGYLMAVKAVLDTLAAFLGYKIRKKRLDISKRVTD